MLYRDICRLLGTFLSAFSLVLLCPLAVGIYYEFFVPSELHLQPHANLAFIATIILGLMSGHLFKLCGRGSSGSFYLREGLASVVLLWLLLPILGGLPFYLSQTLENPVQAYFEGMSALTTTGSSIMEPKAYDPKTGQEIPKVQVIPGVIPTTYTYYGTITPVRDADTGKILYEGVDAVSKSLLWWRCFMQWIGGLGIIVLFIAVLPAMGMGGKILLFAELPGPVKGGFTPRVAETAKQLWKVYLALTLVLVVVLRLADSEMAWYDAFTMSFSTLSTGGAVTHSANIDYFNSTTVEWIIVLFMFLGSVNFTLYHHILKGRFYRLYEPEFVFYLFILAAGTAFVTYQLVGTPNTLLTGEVAGTFSVEQAIRYAIFQIVSAESSTGFATSDYDKWPYAAQTMLLFATLIGGMSGSTAGGIKIIRVYMLLKIIRARLESMFRPEGVRTLRLGDKEVDGGVAFTVLCYFVVMVTGLSLGGFLLICNGVDPDTAITFMACAVNNAGFTFRAANPTESCAFLSNFGCMVSAIWMLLGRLEFFAILVMLMPAFWRKNS